MPAGPGYAVEIYLKMNKGRSDEEKHDLMSASNPHRVADEAEAQAQAAAKAVDEAREDGADEGLVAAPGAVAASCPPASRSSSGRRARGDRGTTTPPPLTRPASVSAAMHKSAGRRILAIDSPVEIGSQKLGVREEVVLEGEHEQWFVFPHFFF